jgi:Matrixin
MSLRRPARWALALCALAGAVPASAHATHGATFLDDDLATYMAIAQAHWGGALPTCVQNGVTVVAAHAILYDDPDPSVAARSMQPGCEIWLDRGHWRAMRPVEACMIVVHEWGHLLGHEHSHDPLDLMAEFPVRPPRECRRAAGSPRRASASAARRCAPKRKHRRVRPAHARSALWACARRSS